MNEQARQMALASEYALLILDLNPVLTARKRVGHRVQSLDTDADDCLTNHFLLPSFPPGSARCHAADLAPSWKLAKITTRMAQPFRERPILCPNSLGNFSPTGA